MDTDVMTRWFSRLSPPPGVLACGLDIPPGDPLSRSWTDELSEPDLTELWTRLAAMLRATVPNSDKADRLRWTFRRHIVAAAVQDDGSLFFLMHLPEAAGNAGVAQLLREFQALRA